MKDMKQTSQATGHIAAFITILIWGTTFISTKVLLRTFTPVEILFIRFAVGYLALWVACPRRLKPDNRRQEWYFAAAGLCGITLYYLLENIALTYTLASNVGVIISIAPFFTAIFAWLFLKGQKPGVRFLAGFVIAMAGICLISFGPGSALKVNPAGDLLAVAAAVVWAAYATLGKKTGAFGYSTIQVTRRTFFYGLVFMIPVILGMRFTGEQFHVEAADFLYPENGLNLLFLGLGASALCFVTWNTAVKALGSVKTSVYIYMVPVVTTVCSALVLKEHITAAAVGGIVLTLAGLLLSQSFQGGKRPSMQKGE